MPPPYERNIRVFDDCRQFRPLKDIARELGLNEKDITMTCTAYSEGNMPIEHGKYYYVIDYPVLKPSCPYYKVMSRCWGICCIDDTNCPAGYSCVRVNTELSGDIAICRKKA